MRCFACVAKETSAFDPLIRTMPATALALPQCTHAIPDTVISFKDSDHQDVDHVYLHVEMGALPIFAPVSSVIKSKGTRSSRMRDWVTYKWPDPNADPCLKSMRWYLLDQALEDELQRLLAPTDKRDSPFPGAHSLVYQVGVQVAGV